MCGFDINTELGESYRLTEEVLQDIRNGRVSKDLPTGAACFIGSARLGAGVRPGDFYHLGTDGGDGPELSIALELMDAAVPDEYREEAEEGDERTYGDDAGPGGAAEAYGFILKHNLEEEYGGAQNMGGDEEESVHDQVAEAANQLYKTALRNVHGLIEEAL